VAPNTKALLKAMKQMAPPMSNKNHKGQQGRVGVIGGSKAYTGAPYFAAQSALLLGADLVTVFCSVEAGLAIKAYSPDLMVRPLLFPAHMQEQAARELEVMDLTPEVVEGIVESIDEWSAKLDVMVVGPGLGKDDLVARTVGRWIETLSHKSASTPAREGGVTPLVLDGDGLHVFQHCAARRSHKSSFDESLVLTPNAAEFRRLWEQFAGKDAPLPMPDFDVDTDVQWLKDNPDGGEISIKHPLAAHTAVLASLLGGATVVRKGHVDVISNGRRAVVVASSSDTNLRRVGGQGDVLAGATGMFLTWGSMRQQRREHEREEARKRGEDAAAKKSDDADPLPPAMLAAFSAAHFCRALGGRAFARHGRSMLASNLLQVLPEVLHEWFPLDGVKVLANKL